jgi:ABC-type branched-subunit amino acid transport system ATPase component
MASASRPVGLQAFGSGHQPDVDEGESAVVVGKNGGQVHAAQFLLRRHHHQEAARRARTALEKLPGYRALKECLISPQDVLPHLTRRRILLLGRTAPQALDGRAGARTFPILLERKDKMGTALSGGQQQMLAGVR